MNIGIGIGRGMNIGEMGEAIERLKKVPDGYRSAACATDAFMGKDTWKAEEFRDALVELLEKARSNWWINKSAKKDLAELDDGDLAVLGVMRLPVDMDGVPIRINDEMENVSGHVRIVVKRLKYSERHGWMIGGARSDDLSEYGLHSPKVLRHYHEPKVEDVLREFAEKITDSQIPGTHPTYEEAIAEYAERLRELLKEKA